MGEGDGQAARRLVAEFRADFPKVVHFLQNARRDRQNLLAGFGNVHKSLAVTDEDLHRQLLFQLADLLGHARLGSKQGLCRFGHVEDDAGPPRKHSAVAGYSPCSPLSPNRRLGARSIELLLLSV
jgi:hypothetical protein